MLIDNLLFFAIHKINILKMAVSVVLLFSSII